MNGKHCRPEIAVPDKMHFELSTFWTYFAPSVEEPTRGALI